MKLTFLNVNWLRLCVMLTLLVENQFQQTKDMQLPRFLAIPMLWLKNHGSFYPLISIFVLVLYFFHGNTVNLLLNLVTGMVSSRNTPCCRRMFNGLLAGLSVDILGLRFYLSSLHCNSPNYCNVFWFCYLLHWWKTFLMDWLCLEVTNKHTHTLCFPLSCTY